MQALDAETISRILDKVFASPDVEDIFHAVVDTFVREPEYLDRFDHEAGEAREDEDPDYLDHDDYVASGVRDDPAYRRVRAVIWFELSAGAATQGAAPFVLGDELLLLVRERLEELLFEAPYRDLFPALMVVLDAIDRKFGARLLEEFRQTRSLECSHALPIVPGRVFPKPWASFRTSKIDSSKRAPMMGRFGPLLILERYLWRLAFARDSDVSLVPALHLESRVQADGDQDEFRVATLSILADMHDVSWEDDDHRFWGDRLKRPKEVYERLDWALQKCREERADLIVLPELNADEEIRRQLADMFAPGEGGHTPQLIVCGALHQIENAERGTYKNRPWVMTRAGQLDWDYWKRERNIENLPHGKRTEALGSVPPHVLAIDLPIGRVAVAICKDMLDASFRQAIEQLRTNVMILISMTGTEAARSFRQHARDMAASSWMVTVYCNSSIHHRWPLHKEHSARPLSFLHPNTQISFEDIPSYELPGENVQAAVGMYTLTPDADGLNVDLEKHFRPSHAPPEEQELGSAAVE